MQDLTFMHPSTRALRRFWTALLGLALSIFWAGCGGGHSPETETKLLEFTQDIGRPAFLAQGNGWALKLTAASLGYRGLGTQQRALLQSPDLLVTDDRGQTLLHLAAQTAIALHPYTEMNWHQYGLENAEATTFEGEDLVWPYLGDRAQVGLLGPTLVLLPEAIVEGDTLVGDLLLRGYEIKHVRSVMPLDQAAGDSLNIGADD